MYKLLVIIGLTTLLLGCAVSQKTYKTNGALDEMISQKRFEIKAKLAQPMVTQVMSQVALSG